MIKNTNRKITQTKWKICGNQIKVTV